MGVEINFDVVIVAEHLEKSFEEKVVLQNICFQLLRGENLAIIGKSGSGKSVLIKCLVNLLRIDRGDLIVLGRNIIELSGKELNEIRRRIGFLFQSGALYDSMTVRENLAFPLIHSLRDRDKMDALIEEALENVKLIEAIHKMPSELSGGMKKRISLARALMLKPEIILYDEPTTGLDPITSREISNLILEIQKKYNASSIIISHDLPCVQITSNRILALNDGKFIAEGNYDQLKRSDNKWIRSFFE